MDERPIYLDNSATTRPYDEVAELMYNMMKTKYGNPSSTHFIGSEIASEISVARKIIADSMRVAPEDIYFTSGGTEANNLAIKGVANAYQAKGKHLITSAIEHPSVLNSFKDLGTKGFKTDFVNVDENGVVLLDHLAKLVSDDTMLVSIMLVNNEIGSIQPIKDIANIVKKNNPSTILHVDAVQAYGKIPFFPYEDTIDLVSISAHKIHGPKGVGALFSNGRIKVAPMISGGGQERNIRSGTENTFGIVGFGKAAEITFNNLDEKIIQLKQLRKMFKTKLLENIPNVMVNSPDRDELCSSHILNVSFMNCQTRDIIKELEKRGIFASTRSACSCRKSEKSHVLKEIGLSNERIHTAVRFSLSYFNTEEDIACTVERLKDIFGVSRNARHYNNVDYKAG